MDTAVRGTWQVAMAISFSRGEKAQRFEVSEIHPDSSTRRARPCGRC